MIKLAEKLPRSVFIDGAEYPVNTDFRIMADFETKINRTDISDKKIFSEIVGETLILLFGEIPKADINTVLEKLLWYYRCGRVTDISANSSFNGNKKRFYDYDEDAEYIYAAFLQQYGDDIINSEMHWWEFRAKFLALTDSTEFVKIMQYRCMDISKIKSSEQRSHIREMQKKFALNIEKQPRYPSLEKRNEDMKRRLRQRYETVLAQADHAERNDLK